MDRNFSCACASKIRRGNSGKGNKRSFSDPLGGENGSVEIPEDSHGDKEGKCGRGGAFAGWEKNFACQPGGGGLHVML